MAASAWRIFGTSVLGTSRNLFWGISMPTQWTARRPLPEASSGALRAILCLSTLSAGPFCKPLRGAIS